MTTEDQVTEKVPLLKRQLGGGSKKPKVESAPKTGKYNIPPRPQVNLMPPEVLQGRDTAVLKKRMIWVIAALILVCIAVYALAFLSRASAEGRHDDALAAADQLTAEKKKYSPVTQVLNSINKTKDSRTFALSTEVNWNAYIYSIQAVLPKGVTVETVNVAGISPGAELAPGQDELTRAGIAVISFTALSETLPDASAWIDALNSVPGLADANLQSSVLQDEDGTELYLVTSTVQVTEEALANRTFPDEEPVAEDESEDGDEG